jgi:hypothetical protein
MGVLIGLTLLFPWTVVAVREFFAVDACLDSRGSFDYGTMTRDFATNHVYVPFSRRHPNLGPAAITGAVTLLLVGGFALASRAQRYLIWASPPNPPLPRRCSGPGPRLRSEPGR